MPQSVWLHGRTCTCSPEEIKGISEIEVQRPVDLLAVAVKVSG